jgi:chemotaxis protein methyltransferase CheR
MVDDQCVAFLQWALPHLGRRWAGYRKVRRRVCKKIGRRAAELGLADLADYRDHLERHPEEWPVLDALTDVTISRFYRDRAVFDLLRDDVLPGLAQRSRDAGTGVVRAWSAGCANGEEPYTLAILWDQAVAAETTDPRLEILATDIKQTVLARAERARYPLSSTRDLPDSWRDVAFHRDGNELVLDERFRRAVTFVRHDIRDDPPPGPFDLVLCRYQAFTYFDDDGQRATFRALAQVTRPGAVLVLGGRERPPADDAMFEPVDVKRGVYRRSADMAITQN